MPSGCPMSSHQHMADLVSSRLKAKGLWRRVSMAEVAAHNHKDDAWIVVEGKVSLLRGSSTHQQIATGDFLQELLQNRAPETAALPPPAPDRVCIALMQVYDITHHVQAHKGWTCGCATSTLLATLRVMGEYKSMLLSAALCR